MNAREIVEKYYELANAGRWEEWCDLFDEDIVMDEQLAGHVEGLTTLRGMMKGMDGYARFQNVPKHIVIDEGGQKAAVASHISAVAASAPGQPIEAEVMNYFEFRDGKISYFSNYHDSRPFDPFMNQVSKQAAGE